MKPSDGHKPPLILAIDDETDVLDIVQTSLQGAGFNVLTAANPSTGLELFEQRWRDIGLVLLDYLMPEMTGDLVFESLQRINPAVRVILLTACEDNVARKMFAQGLRGYVQKPFYLDDLIQRVREELEAT
jgi:two-component system cell cycle sensor histidine kinase/response regulator CckA